MELNNKKNPKNFKPQKAEDSFGEKKKDVIVNKSIPNPESKDDEEPEAQPNKKTEPKAYK